MPLGSNRDYKTSERSITKLLAQHKEMMNRLQADFPGLSDEIASREALQIIRGKRPYPIYGQKL